MLKIFFILNWRYIFALNIKKILIYIQIHYTQDVTKI